MNAYRVCLRFLFPAIESNDDCAEEGEVFEYQEKGDQGQAIQGKPSTCCITEPYQVTIYYSTLTLFTMHCLPYIAISP
jgi:hypothetical protein